MTLRIKNWNKFQHFKDRHPPWVRLYRDVLDDPDWHELDGDSAKVLTMLWLIASEDKGQSGKLPDTRTLAFRLRIDETKVNQVLTNLSNWLIQDDINPISERYQLDAPETEAETETEKEKQPRKRAEYPSDFVEWFSLYPEHRKPSKSEAYKQWKTQHVNGSASILIAKLKDQISAKVWDEGHKFCPNAQKYLKERRWECDVEQKQVRDWI